MAKKAIFCMLILALANFSECGFFFKDPTTTTTTTSEPEVTTTQELPIAKENAHQPDIAHDHKLSDQVHYSDSNNDSKFEHNLDYDHEAFIGKEEDDKFKRMSPEESKLRLGKIVDKIDSDLDGFIESDEMSKWIKEIRRNGTIKDTESRWELFKESSSLDEYLKVNYGALNNWSDEEKETRKDDYKTYLKLMERDKRRFKAADVNQDGKLDKLEYTDFVHPEESNIMRSIVVDETMEDLDKNGDKLIDINEFINDMHRDRVEGAEEPDWVKHERDHFKSMRDKNNDGVLDREEISNWILPSDFDHTLNEAKHLIFEADVNEDGKLTKEEILDKYKLFVSSQATAYGEAIYEHEDL